MFGGRLGLRYILASVTENEADTNKNGDDQYDD